MNPTNSNNLLRDTQYMEDVICDIINIYGNAILFLCLLLLPGEFFLFSLLLLFVCGALGGQEEGRLRQDRSQKAVLFSLSAPLSVLWVYVDTTFN